jgi:hypothetical protein
MKRKVLQQMADDLQALERFLRGSQPGYGKSFASLLLHSLQSASKDHPALIGAIEELVQGVSAFVEAQRPDDALKLWLRVENAVAACREALGEQRLDSHGDVEQEDMTPLR